MFKSFSIWAQYGRLPHFCSYLIGLVANWRWRPFKNWAIKRFIRKYEINMAEVKLKNLADYPTFNSFFIRQLDIAARPIAQGEKTIASPVDGAVSQIGLINQDTLIQAKNFSYKLTQLLGGNALDAQQFHSGSFGTFYLAPKNYHRVHMPVSGRLRSTIYIPGKLFSVNTHTQEYVPDLFASNERLVCLFDTAVGPMAIIMVGAILVSSIHTNWESPCIARSIVRRSFADEITLHKGEELGYFEMGSTVIVLFPQDKVHWARHLAPNVPIQMGQCIGELH